MPESNANQFINDYLAPAKPKEKREPTSEELAAIQLQALLATIEPKVKREISIDTDELFSVDIHAARVHPAVNEALRFMNLPIIVPDWVDLFKSRQWQIITLSPGRQEHGLNRSIKLTMREKPAIEPDRGLAMILSENMQRFKNFFNAELKKRKAEGKCK